MFQIVFCNGIGALLSWNYSSTVQFGVIADVILLVLGVLLGLFARPKRWLTIALVSLAVLGLLVVLKSAIFGLSSDAYVAFPFIGEAVCVGAVVALIVFAIKRTRA